MPPATDGACSTSPVGTKAAGLRQADDILNIMVSPALLLDETGLILAANDAGRQVVQRQPALFVERGYLGLRRSEEADMVSKALDRIATGHEHREIVVLKSRPGSPILMLRLVATNLVARGIVMMVEDLLSEISDIHQLANLMGLTLSQTRVAAYLAQGLGIPDIATLLNRRETTLRTHVREAIDRLNLSGQQHLAICTLRMARFVGLMQTPAPPDETP